jgi:hypothetical protein
MYAREVVSLFFFLTTDQALPSLKRERHDKKRTAQKESPMKIAAMITAALIAGCTLPPSSAQPPAPEPVVGTPAWACDDPLPDLVPCIRLGIAMAGQSAYVKDAAYSGDATRLEAALEEMERRVGAFDDCVDESL